MIGNDPTKEGKSKSRFRWERARWSRSIVEKLRARMDDFVIDYIQGKQSGVVNKHICGSTGELAEDWRDVAKVLGSVGREVRVAELSIGEFGEALRFVF